MRFSLSITFNAFEIVFIPSLEARRFAVPQGIIPNVLVVFTKYGKTLLTVPSPPTTRIVSKKSTSASLSWSIVIK